MAPTRSCARSCDLAARTGGPGREPDKGRDLSTVERTELRQFGNQGPGDRLSDAGHGSEEILFLDQTADPRI